MNSSLSQLADDDIDVMVAELNREKVLRAVRSTALASTAAPRKAPDAVNAPSGSAEDDPVVNDDVVWGGTAIGHEIKRTRKQTYHLYETGLLNGAVKKVGARLVGSRSKLRALVLGD